MGILSSSVSVTRYRVEGDLVKPVTETVAAALKKNSISEIDERTSETTSGWTSFNHPYQPDFEGSSFVFGPYLVFSLRIDKKNIPPKTIQKYYAIELGKKSAETGRTHMSTHEKKMIKDHVLNVLNLRMPATPNIFDILWNYEESSLWFFSNLKAANEVLESLFSKSFKLSLIRLFPYTTARILAGLSNNELDTLVKLTPARFTG
jgi:hypothetical protein